MDKKEKDKLEQVIKKLIKEKNLIDTGIEITEEGEIMYKGKSFKFELKITDKYSKNYVNKD
ncbi:MAG: hypothetical protein ACOCP8_03395 [archaeon]